MFRPRWRLQSRLLWLSDPFLKMIESNKTYGFTIAVKELRETVPNMFRYASAYKRLNNIPSKGLWEMFVEPQPEKEEPLAEDDPNYKPPLPEEILRTDPSRNSPPEIDPEGMEGEKYNMCHYWSNFEIAKLSFFRSKEYEDFFQMMDRSGGFWMERVRLDNSLPSSPKRPPYTTYSIMYTDPYSGAMHLFTPLPPVSFLLPAIFTISATLGTDTLPSSIVQPTLRRGSCLASLTLRRRRSMNASERKRTNTGKTTTSPRRMVLGAAAAAIQTLSMSRAKKAAAWQNGLTLPEAGPVLERR